MTRLPLLLPTLLLAACAAGSTAPSLATRSAETLDPRLPVPDTSALLAADPGLARQLAGFVAQARAGEDEFNSAMGRAEQLAAVAGAPASENWIAAQQALSGAVAAQYRATRALADVDALASTRIASAGGITPAVQIQIREASEAIGAIASRQGERVDAVQARL